MPNQFLSDQFGDIEDYFITDYELIDRYIGDTLWVWGDNDLGQLGVNDTTTRSTPVTTLLGGTNWKSISVGAASAAIKTDGTLWGWGYNLDGNLGTNGGGNRSTPVTTLLGGNNWKQVSFTYVNSAAIKTDGTLWVWGQGAFGVVGVNDTTTRNTPVTTLLGGNNWKQVSVGYFNIAAIKTDGTLWTWGRNAEGQLGVNDTTARSTPVTTLLGGTNWKSVAEGGNGHVAALKTDGTLWSWGNNTSGPLGVNDTTTRSTPVTTLLGGTNWKSIACGGGHTVALKTDGTLWSWGLGGSGQLGVNDTTRRNTPVTTLLGGTNWKSISGGSNHTVALKTDGTLWTWGLGGSGQLGVNNTTSRSTPVTTLLGGNNWKSIASGNDYTAALTAGQAVDFS
jgi:alpha-tubulin suppressor-like RCC1 family protein